MSLSGTAGGAARIVVAIDEQMVLIIQEPKGNERFCTLSLEERVVDSVQECIRRGLGSSSGDIFITGMDQLRPYLVASGIIHQYKQMSKIEYHFDDGIGRGIDRDSRRDSRRRIHEVILNSNLIPNFNEIHLDGRYDNDQAEFLENFLNPDQIKKLRVELLWPKYSNDPNDPYYTNDHLDKKQNPGLLLAPALGRFQLLEELKIDTSKWTWWSNEWTKDKRLNKEVCQKFAASLGKMSNLRRLEFTFLESSKSREIDDPQGCLEILYSAFGYLHKPNNTNHLPELLFEDLSRFGIRSRYRIDYDSLNKILTEGPPFLLAIEQAGRSGIIPAKRDNALDAKHAPEQGCLYGGYRYDGNLQPWVQAMCKIRCHPKDRLNFLYYFLRQLQFNREELDLLHRISCSDVPTQKRRRTTEE